MNDSWLSQSGVILYYRSKPKIKNGTQCEGEKSLNTQSNIDMSEKELKEIPGESKIRMLLKA